MATDIGKDELLQLFEKGLVVEDGKARGELDARTKRLADRGPIQKGLDVPNRRLPPPVLVDDERDTSLPAGCYHPVVTRRPRIASREK